MAKRLFFPVIITLLICVGCALSSLELPAGFKNYMNEKYGWSMPYNQDWAAVESDQGPQNVAFVFPVAKENSSPEVILTVSSMPTQFKAADVDLKEAESTLVDRISKSGAENIDSWTLERSSGKGVRADGDIRAEEGDTHIANIQIYKDYMVYMIVAVVYGGKFPNFRDDIKLMIDGFDFGEN